MTIDKWEAPTSTRLYMLQREIAKLYGGSVDDIRICVGTYAEDQAYTDPNLTLKDIGIATDGLYTVYYDFKVKSSPLLNSALTYKIYEEKWINLSLVLTTLYRLQTHPHNTSNL